MAHWKVGFNAFHFDVKLGRDGWACDGFFQPILSNLLIFKFQSLFGGQPCSTDLNYTPTLKVFRQLWGGKYLQLISCNDNQTIITASRGEVVEIWLNKTSSGGGVIPGR